MKNLSGFDTQTICDIHMSAKMFLLNRDDNTYLEMAYGSAGYLFTDSKKFADRFSAFIESGIKIENIMNIINIEMKKRIL